MNAVVWLNAALRDFDEAFRWYQDRRSGLGTEFARELDALLDRIASFPRSCPVVYEGLRRGLVPRFPFGLYYLLEEERIVIFGLLHLKRDVLKHLSERRP